MCDCTVHLNLVPPPHPRLTVTLRNQCAFCQGSISTETKTVGYLLVPAVPSNVPPNGSSFLRD